MSKRERDAGLEVEELDVGAWGAPGSEWSRPVVDRPVVAPPTGPPGPPGPAQATTTGPEPHPAPPPAARSWWQRHGNHAIAGAGGVALLVAVVAVASGPGSDPSAAPSTPAATIAPSTTVGRPIETAAPSTTAAPGDGTVVAGTGTAVGAGQADYRFVLTSPPDGFEPAGLDELDGNDRFGSTAPPILFAADGTTWDTGPWLLVSSGGEFGPGVVFPFARPPIGFTIGDLAAETGPGPDGVEVTAFERDGHQVGVAARGLPGLTTSAVAAQLTVTDGGVAVPDSAVPAGLRARPDIDITTWEFQWVPGTRTNVTYGRTSGDGWMSISVRPRGVAPDVVGAAAYVLSDLRHFIVGGATGVAGTYRARYGDPVQFVLWQLADREYFASGTGVSLEELIAAAGSVVQPGDPGWRQARWDDLRTAVRQCCDAASPPADALPATPVATASTDDRWELEAWVVGDTVMWNGRAVGTQDFLSLTTPVGAPLLRVGTRSRWPGMPAEFPVAAVALVDRSMTGGSLRLTTTGAEPLSVEVPLQPLGQDALAPYLAGAVVLPWTDGGFVAQLIAPDGQTVAVQTDADLP